MTQDPDQIRDGIDQTQRELSANVDALTAKLSPQRILREQVQRARTAVGSMKERASATATQKSTAAGGTAAPVVSTAEGTVSSAKGTVSAATSSAARTAGTVTAAARRGIEANPVAAGLIVLGVSWLLAWLIWPSRTGSATPGGRGR
ncbi:MAG TPA: DUF3618 domain-containing protein [Streptosporangiaceae bacterium]|jgi:Protein of unknown function (DUF3618)|nr:DUF3618 domain-containing protein [Streptosporangiaceae bacterium]